MQEGKNYKSKTLVIFFCLINLHAMTQGIRFEENLSWSEVKAKAKLENKYIFIDAYATWCLPCKEMAAEIFPQKEVGQMINSNFVAVKVQMDKTKNDDEFVKNWYADAEVMAKESRLNAYPTFLFFSPEGKLVHKAIGYKNGPDLLTEAKDALNPSTQFFVLVEKYKAGRLDTAQIKALAVHAKQMGDNETALIVARGYIKSIPEKNIYRKDNLIFISQFLTGSTDPNFNIFFKNARRVDKVVEKNFAENTVMGIIAREEITPYDKAATPDWDAMEKRIVSKFGALGEERIWGHRLVYYISVKDWDNFARYYKKYFDRAIPNERSFIHINNLSWPIFEHVSDPLVLSTAISAMKYDIEKFSGNNPHAIDTYANLLYKFGDKNEAIKWQAKAVELSNNEKEMVATLKKMIRGEKTWNE